MSERVLRGSVHVYGDDIDTDRIIAGKHTKTLDLASLAAHVLEDLDPAFRARVRAGDILVAGWNFGCGSSREQAPLALKSCGLQAVVARSFAGIFFRNAINVGLPLVEIADHRIAAGSTLEIHLEDGRAVEFCEPKAAARLNDGEDFRRGYACRAMPKVLVEILRAGGLVPYLLKNGDYAL